MVQVMSMTVTAIDMTDSKTVCMKDYTLRKYTNVLITVYYISNFFTFQFTSQDLHKHIYRWYPKLTSSLQHCIDITNLG